MQALVHCLLSLFLTAKALANDVSFTHQATEKGHEILSASPAPVARVVPWKHVVAGITGSTLSSSLTFAIVMGIMLHNMPKGADPPEAKAAPKNRHLSLGIDHDTGAQHDAVIERTLEPEQVFAVSFMAGLPVGAGLGAISSLIVKQIQKSDKS